MRAMARIRVLLVDDHELVRFGLRTTLEVEDDFEVVGEAESGEQAVAMASSLGPSVIVMDVRMAGMDGIEACRQVKSEHPEIGILILTSFGAEDAVISALLAGANGFLLKNTGRAEVLRALRLIAAGQSLLDPAITQQVTRKLVQLSNQEGPSELASLSAREREVLALVAEGCTNREIAARLVISDATARNHVSHILEKLGLGRRSEAAALAARLGVTSPRNPNNG